MKHLLVRTVVISVSVALLLVAVFGLRQDIVSFTNPVVENLTASLEESEEALIMESPDNQTTDSGPAITELYPTKFGGRTWESRWDENGSRFLSSGQRDPHDDELIARGDGSVSIDGQGVATLQGSYPRMYVYDRNKSKKWGDVEITVYAKRVSESGVTSSQGIVIGARSEHQDATLDNPCSGATYYGRLLYDGRAVFQKEVIHEGAYSINKPEEHNMAAWDTVDGTMPRNIWIGVKYVVRTNPDGKSVSLELYRDLTDGKNGGTWEKVAEYVDDGSWSQTDTGKDVKKVCGYPASKILLNPGTSVFIRNDLVSDVRYKDFSIREIEIR